MDWWDKVLFEIVSENQVNGGSCSSLVQEETQRTLHTSCRPPGLAPGEGSGERGEVSWKGSNQLQRPCHGPERGPQNSELAILLLHFTPILNCNVKG